MYQISTGIIFNLQEGEILGFTFILKKNSLPRWMCVTNMDQIVVKIHGNDFKAIFYSIVTLNQYCIVSKLIYTDALKQI